MNEYLVDTEKFNNNAEHKAFYIKWNSLVKKAWTRTDSSLTKISAGYYIVRVNNELHECSKHETSDGWLTQKTNSWNDSSWIASLTDFRLHIAELRG